MCRTARRVLSRLYPAFFLGAIGIVAFRHFDGSHRSDGYLMGDAMVLCQLGLAGVLSTAVRELRRGPSGAAVRREAAQLLLRALEAMPEQPEEDGRRLRAVSPRSATLSSTAAGGESAPPPGA